MSFIEKLNKQIIFFDGGMGTLLLQNGLKQGELPESLNFTNPGLIERIHREYYMSGSDCVTANTFGANSIKLKGFEKSSAEVVEAAASCAKRARDSFSDGRERYIALDIGPTGQLLKPLGELEFDEAYNSFAEMATAGEKAGADLVIIETMIDSLELKAAVLAVKENTHLPVIASSTFDEKGFMLTGGSIESICAMLEGLGVDAIGINCGFGPKQMKKLFERLKKVCSVPISVMPNADLPEICDGELKYDVLPEEFSSYMSDFARGGASIVGGCCGTTPEYISKIVEKCRGIKPLPVVDKGITFVSSAAICLDLDKRPVVIGERINPTGKKIFKEALRNGDFDYIVEKAVEQQNDGADMLDVNVGLPEINEKATMLRAVRELQSATPLPLQIDSSDPEVIEAALRIYNGKAMVNSVNGKREVMKKIFPIVKKYGGVVVGLTLDENGIPETAEGRFEIAKRIVSTAEEYGIAKKDIIIDTLTMSVSSDPNAARITLDALELVKKKLGVKTILGVSNVSFGLPRRDIVNSAFFALALKSGLDAGIINPSIEEMMNTFYAVNMLSGYADGCDKFVARFTEKTETSKKDELFQAIFDGSTDAAYTITVEKLKSASSDEIISGILIPALNEVGSAFELNRIFLPQLIKSAKAAQSAFGAIKSALGEQSKTGEIRGKVILATVKGDIHDIGKNIVKIMLQNYGYDVVDLGKDVDETLILETAKKENIRLIGLSALMTTTVSSMKSAIELLKKELPDCSVMVGGAVLTEEYAKEINADFYSKDAMESVKYADRFFGFA